jgi:hypothetical protein
MMARLMLLQNRRRRKGRRILIMHESTGWFDPGMTQYGIGSSLVLVVFVVVFVVYVLADTCTEYKFVSGWAGAESTCRGVSESLTGLFLAFSCCSSRRRD